MLLCVFDYHDPALGLMCSAGDRLICTTRELEAWLIYVSQGAFVLHQPSMGRRWRHPRSSRQAHGGRNNASHYADHRGERCG